ncbi:hypothetical protein FH972_025222 [Carpinus fangiana]|uniref:Uncharacterized protein n=1 Tax=Carpinus fangiana TaxID=176857 RepID=A0A5N6L0D8_9ROSI|nr:hypothetical protein FH972_025222 [Carpinus fangiana]
MLAAAWPRSAEPRLTLITCTAGLAAKRWSQYFAQANGRRQYPAFAGDGAQQPQPRGPDARDIPSSSSRTQCSRKPLSLTAPARRKRARPKPLGVPNPKRISTPAGQRLSTIVEGAPAEPSRASGHRLSNMSRLHLGRPPNHDAEKQPPEYAAVWDRTAAGAGSFSGADDLGWSGKSSSRGGWKRLAAIIAVVLVVIIALAVGLGVGLTRKKSSDSSSEQQQPSGTDSLNTPQPFPLGSWSLSTALSTVDTACTSAADTWACPPYQTYAQSPSGAETVYNWRITASNPSAINDSLLISSTDNYFLLMFSNTTLSLTDAGQPTERYTFSIDAPKQVYPTQSLSDSSGRDTCFFNGTLLSASLYTRMPTTYNPTAGANGTTAMAATVAAMSNAFADWPYAVQVNFTQPGGNDVPDCYPVIDNVVSGPRITSGLTAQPESSTCSCNYANYDL